LNPQSEEAKEHELLIQERTKWIAQRQEEELAQARQRMSARLQYGPACDAQSDSTCGEPSVQPSRTGDSRQRLQQSAPSIDGVPGDSRTPGMPGVPGNPIMRAQSTTIGDELTPVSSQSLLADSYGHLQTLNSDRPNSLAPQPSQMDAYNPSRSPQMFSSFPSASGNSGSGYANNDFLARSGNMAGIGFPGDAAFDTTGLSNREVGQPSIDNSGASPMPFVSGHAAISPLSPSPDLIRKPGPYEYIPSLYDMYVQAVPRPDAPRRFGSDVFENNSQNSQLIPMDLPAGPEYVVGPGDGLSVDLWGSVSQRLARTVDREGRVSLPEVGPIAVSGKSLAEVQETLQQVLRTQFHDVSADVSLARLRTIRVYEVGDVSHPGAYDISSLSTPLNALFAAGGPTSRGSLRTLKHYRGTQLIQTVDMYDLLLHGVKTSLQRLENGDTVQIPPMGSQVTVEGMVRRPAIYELRDETSLANVIELAGGLLPAATLSHIEVQRTVAHEKQTMIGVNIADSETASEATKKLESFEIHDGDRIRIYPIAPYNQDSIYVEGHVVRPGRYSFRPEMRLTDVITSYKDLLPEPANQYAEIIRLNAPDFHPSVEGFDLADALSNPAHAPVLHAMDTIRIYSRFDFENPPAVSVLGDVRAPGTYKTSGQIRLIDAVHLAGGLAADAQTVDAQVFRYLPGGKSKIFSIDLGQALAGNDAENILLQPRDRLLIHKSLDAVEPNTIYVQGEVEKPGRYPLTTNMRVADLIRIGGGLKPGADMQTADLTQYRWTGQWTDQGTEEGSGKVPELTTLTGEHRVIALSAALANDPNSNLALNNGDVLTIRQLPGWNDLGASITLKGEIRHPGTYGICPGERLSSVLERAGGFSPEAYPYGALLQRSQVREMESKEQAELLTRLRDSQTSLELLPETDSKQKTAKEMAVQQAQSSIEQLSASPVLGRVTIRISSQIDRWKNTAADVEIRAGDTLVVPKRPSYVMVTGQVFNPTAVSFHPGKSANWYLGQSGGPTQLGNKKGIFVIRADGTVIGSRRGIWSGESLSASLQPGDTVVVPERAIAGGPQWQNVLLTAQTASSIASAVFIAVHY
jgi:protein involved in polysaccharide export with SLBB domain